MQNHTDDIDNLFKLLPGKSGKGELFLPLWMHLKDTEKTMEFLCSNRVSDSVIKASGMVRSDFYRTSRFLALVHDIGKCTPRFLANISTNINHCRETLESIGLSVPSLSYYASTKAIPHAVLGEVLLRSFNCPDGVCSVVGAHHGKPSAEQEKTFDYKSHLEAYSLNYYASQKSIWNSIQLVFLERALKLCGYASVSELPTLSNCAQMLLSGLLIQSDWIASNQYYFPLISEECDESENIYPVRSLQALKRTALPSIWHINTESINNEHCFQNRFGFSPNLLQKASVEVSQKAFSPGLLIIEAQMGLGKTEAALASAEILAAKSGCGGIFFGLPTQATSNGVFPRIVKWSQQVSKDSAHSIRLVHGMAEFNDEYQALFKGSAIVSEDDGESGVIANSWFSGRKQALLADFVVGTVDSALMSALEQKHVMLRHLGLCGKTVIIDECHAYDAYMSHFLLRMLQWLGAYKVPVILLSATLPAEKKRQMVQAYLYPYKSLLTKKIDLPKTNAYPLITWACENKAEQTPVENNEPFKTVEIIPLEGNELANVLRDKLSGGGCAGIIVNTVKRAQKIAESLKTEFPQKRVHVYHAQFVAQDRADREKTLLTMIGKDSTPEQRNNTIIVGTQVLEQSLDIDFDFLITDLCPMDLLLQRIGRLHRHKRCRPEILKNPICMVLKADEDTEQSSKSIYGEWLLKQTLKHLPRQIQLPLDIPKLVDHVYAAPCDDSKADPSWLAFLSRTEIETEKAENWCLPRPKMSRIEALNSIVGMLDHPVGSDKAGEAAVRDGMSSIDVLIMCRKSDELIGFLPWLKGAGLRRDSVPADEEARKIAMQRLRLPFVFGIGKNKDEVLEILEHENSNLLPLWQESPWLKGELIMLLDENGNRELCNYKLQYIKETGLHYERIGE